MSLYKLDKDDDEIDFEDKEPYCETLDDSGADLATIQPIQKNTSFCTLNIFISVFSGIFHILPPILTISTCCFFVKEIIKTSLHYFVRPCQRNSLHFHHFSF